MIRLPKVSDPADLMMRSSLFRGNPVQERFVGVPSAQLFNPKISPAVGKVDNLMPEFSREELAELIARQQGLAEKTIQNLRENQQEQFEAPASAMEEYYMAILKDIRKKEQAEIDNAYLTQQQKADLQASALARKAGIDGNLVRYADDLVRRDDEIDGIMEREEEAAAQREARQSMMPSAGDVRMDDEMGRKTAASMMGAAAAAPAAASASSAEMEAAAGTQDELAGVVRSTQDLLTDITGRQGVPGSAREAKAYVMNNHTTIAKRFNRDVGELVAAGRLDERSAQKYRSRMATFLKSGAKPDMTRLRALVREIQSIAIS